MNTNVSAQGGSASGGRKTTIILQTLLVVIGLGVLAFMLWEPHLEGKNVNSTTFEIYFKDPFLAYAYVSSIAFFVTLYQGFKALGLVRENKAYSPETLKALRTIKYCAMALVVLIVGALSYIVITMRGKDDIAGGIALGLFMIIISATIATTTAMFEKRIRRLSV